MLKPKQLITTLAASAAVFAATHAARAQLVYSQDFSSDDSSNWVVNYSHSGSNYVNFNFDYAANAGIPAAPHSQNGNTKALKLSPDITSGSLIGAAAVPGVSVSPTNFSITANFDMHADMWINYNGSGPATLTTGGGGSGSTILYGCGYGTAGNSAQVAGSCDSILVGTCTDTGTSAEMRMYGPSAIGQASYQNGVYQTTGTATPSYPGEPFVYNNPSGTRAFYTASTWTSVPTPNWLTFFPATRPPAAQIGKFAQQANIQCNPGAPDFAWHDVEVQKIGNVIVYLIDGHLVATGNYSSAGTPSGDKLVFTAFDINSTVSTDPNFVNLNFVLFANIVVSNLDSVVNVSTSVATASEADTNTPAVFTLTRNPSSTPLTVNFTLGGTATNGVQYKPVPLSVTFPADATTVDVDIYPTDDGIPRATTSVILTLQSGTGYAGAGNAVVNILDNDPVTIDITGGSQAYGRYTNTVGTGNNDFVPFTFNRRGKLSTGADIVVNLAYSGSAVSGVDFQPIGTVTIPENSPTNTLYISPIDDPNVFTNRTIVATIVAGSGYAIGTNSASGTIVPAHYAPAQIIYTNDLQSNDSTNWNVVYGSGDTQNNTANYSADFGMNLSAAAGGIVVPPPPGGNANALHLTCNKQSSFAPGAVNAYLTNIYLSGNFSVRFNMNLIQGQQNGTEAAIFGINHSGSLSNWVYGSGYITNINWSSDGIWYYVTAQPAGSAAGDFQEFTGLGGTNGNSGWTRITSKTQTSYTQVYKDNPGPFTALDGFGNQTPGVPANSTPSLGYDASTWADVEIKQQDDIVTMSINRTVIFVYTNTTVWKGGYLMLGYADPFGGSSSTPSVGSADAGVYYANLQIVQNPNVTSTGLAISGTNVLVNFTTTSAADTASSFSLLTSTNLNYWTNFTGLPAATFAPTGSNAFQATTPFTGGAKRFYRVIHN